VKMRVYVVHRDEGSYDLAECAIEGVFSTYEMARVHIEGRHVDVHRLVGARYKDGGRKFPFDIWTADVHAYDPPYGSGIERIEYEVVDTIQVTPTSKDGKAFMYRFPNGRGLHWLGVWHITEFELDNASEVWLSDLCLD